MLRLIFVIIHAKYACPFSKNPYLMNMLLTLIRHDRYPVNMPFALRVQGAIPAVICKSLFVHFRKVLIENFYIHVSSSDSNF